MTPDPARDREHWKLAWDFCIGEHGYNETTGEPTRRCLQCEGLKAGFDRLAERAYAAGVAAERARWAAVPHVYGHGYHQGRIEVLIEQSVGPPHDPTVCARLGGQCLGRAPATP